MSYMLGLMVPSGCANFTTTPPPTIDSLPSLTCPDTLASIPTSQDQAMATETLQKRLHERERTIAIQSQRIKVLSSQLDALKQIDLDTRRPS